jgi:hypothetical protein
MKNYNELKEERSKKYEELFLNLGVFYAFSMEQFKEGQRKNPLLPDEKYTSIGMGAYVRNTNTKKLFEGLESIDKWFLSENKKLKEDKQAREKVILDELVNHEAFYTGYVTDAFEVLKPLGYTKKELVEVYRKHYKNYCD